jgi:hypothetical protein
MPRFGYVGVESTSGPAVGYLESDFWQGKDLGGQYRHPIGEPEYIVPVNWIKTFLVDEAIYGHGLFASQHSTCRLRDQQILKVLTETFGVPYLELQSRVHDFPSRRDSADHLRTFLHRAAEIGSRF